MYKGCSTCRVWRQHTAGCTDSALHRAAMTVMDRGDQPVSQLWYRTCGRCYTSECHTDVDENSGHFAGCTLSDHSSAHWPADARKCGCGRGCQGNRPRYEAGSRCCYHTTLLLDVDILDDHSHICSQSYNSLGLLSVPS